MLQEASPPRWNSSKQRMAGHGVIMMSHIDVGVQRVGGECHRSLSEDTCSRVRSVYTAVFISATPSKVLD